MSWFPSYTIPGILVVLAIWYQRWFVNSNPFCFLWPRPYAQPDMSAYKRVQRSLETKYDNIYMEYQLTGTPIILTKLLDDVRAKTLWTPRYFATHFGYWRIVTDNNVVEQANQIESEGDMTLANYVDWLETYEAELKTSNGSGSKQKIKYWSEDERFWWKHYTQLGNDLPILLWLEKYYHTADVYLWMGPAGSKTGLHVDPDSFQLLLQITGTKNVTLYPPGDWPYLYETNRWDRGAVCSTVDVFNQSSWAAHPLFAHTHPVPTILNAGEVLLIPPGWWHAVEALSSSISVGVAAVTVLDRFRWLPMQVFEGLHQLGLYKRGMCTCHDDDDEYLSWTRIAWKDLL